MCACVYVCRRVYECADVVGQKQDARLSVLFACGFVSVGLTICDALEKIFVINYLLK